MANEKVKASIQKTGQDCEVEYDFGNDLDNAIELFGKETVFGYFKGQATVRLQAGLRSAMERGIDPAAFARGWKPGVTAPSIAADPFSAAVSAYARMTDEEKANFLSTLK